MRLVWILVCCSRCCAKGCRQRLRHLQGLLLLLLQAATWERKYEASNELKVCCKCYDDWRLRHGVQAAAFLSQVCIIKTM